MAERFGVMPDGEEVPRVVIRGGGLTANIISFGATLQDLRLEGHEAPLVMGYGDLESYLKCSAYLGATVGRVANRISRGRTVLDGKTYDIDRNFIDKHTLHGGANGISSRNWHIVDHGDDHVTLRISDRGEETGFPGDCEITCTYSVSDQATLQVELSARCSVETLCNLAHHSYFNLLGHGTILDHDLQLAAECYLPVDVEMIPTGEIAAVAGTPFDFRTARKIASGEFIDFDHNYCLADARRSICEIAKVSCDPSGVELIISSTEPGVQFYSGVNIPGTAPGLGGEFYGRYSGLALEPQGWPDANNQPGFPSIRLSPEETYLQTSRYQFRRYDPSSR